MSVSLDVDPVVDIRCTHRLGDSPFPSRCQLLAGHQDAHAVMYCARGRRAVRRWTDAGGTADETDRFEMLPWVRGLPLPAWAE
jgi:hypothetical protein